MQSLKPFEANKAKLFRRRSQLWPLGSTRLSRDQKPRHAGNLHQPSSSPNSLTVCNSFCYSIVTGSQTRKRPYSQQHRLPQCSPVNPWPTPHQRSSEANKSAQDQRQIKPALRNSVDPQGQIKAIRMTMMRIGRSLTRRGTG
jgi:hypothetical protein